MIPLWKDIKYTTTGDSFVFRLITGDGSSQSHKAVTICQGLAYPYPDGTISIDVSEFVRNYMATYAEDEGLFVNFDREDTSYNALRTEPKKAGTVRFQSFSGEPGTTLETYSFIDIWDDSVDEFSGDKVLSNPINGHLDPRAIFFYTIYKSQPGTIEVDTE